ncbi:MAG: hydroxymethylpyrimidine/phosphomethylpyrimidine kinase [Verrucomicrobiota bacterium]|jgi:hydroxymethylpyrimidine/phosphomethylpyrimidine kinase
MIHRRPIPVALTIAGSDTGGGAGIQADLKTFAAMDVHGTSAITALTAQNPDRISRMQAATPAMLLAQLTATFGSFTPDACKTGMLCSGSLVRVVARFFRENRGVPLVVDPVFIATSGVALLERSALGIFQRELLPRASLVTPNVQEAECILATRIRSEEDLRRAARLFHDRFGCAALVKGGHLRGRKAAVDIFFDGRTELLLSAPFIRHVKTHGTGCIYSAAITAHLARGCPLEEAVRDAKEFITQSIFRSRRAGAHDVLNPFWNKAAG